jgi:hypothetical protein
MGKASSAKKVARAARAGGRVSGRQPRSLLFPGVVVLIFVLGVSLVAYARTDRRNDDLGGVPQIGDHIHQAFGVYVCDQFLTALPLFESVNGIHTHADGVIHIHPKSALASGANATLGRFFKDARDEGKLDLSVSDTKLTYLDEDYEEGTTKCEGVDTPELRMAYWSNVQDEASKPEITTGNFNDLRLTKNGAGITLFYGDPKADIPKPPSAANLAELGAADGGQAADPGSTTTAPGDATTTTAATDPSGVTTTTAAGAETTTTAGP